MSSSPLWPPDDPLALTLAFPNGRFKSFCKICTYARTPSLPVVAMSPLITAISKTVRFRKLFISVVWSALPELYSNWIPKLKSVDGSTAVIALAYSFC